MSALFALLGALEPGHPVGFAVHDDELRFVLVTPSLAAVAGVAAEEHHERTVADLMPGLGSAALAVQRRALDEDRALEVELSGVAPGTGGRPRTWVAHYHPLQHAGRRLLAAVTLDVTDRVAAQAALERHRAMLAEAERLAALGSYCWDVETGGEWTWSEQLFRLAGLRPSARAPGWEAWLATVAPADREALRAVLRDAVRDGAPFDVSFRQRLPGGGERVIRSKGSAQCGDDGRTKRVEGFSQDITELVDAEARQRALAELGREALEGLPAHALAARAARAVADTLHARRVVIIGADGSAIGEAGPASGAAAAAERTPVGAPAARIRVEGAAALDGGADAFLQAVTGVLADAEARRAAEAEIAEQAAARGRLLAQSMDAEAATRSEISDALAAGALEELLAVADALEPLDPADERARVHAERARAGVQRALHALGDIMLDLDPAGGGTRSGGLVAALGAIADKQARHGGFACEVSVDAGAAGGRHDELVVAAARELLTNVAKHAAAREVHLDVRCATDGVILEVADDGRGMDVTRVRAAAAEGHIGLASTRERVLAAGGRLDVDARPGHGTRAVVVLPSA